MSVPISIIVVTIVTLALSESASAQLYQQDWMDRQQRSLQLDQMQERQHQLQQRLDEQRQQLKNLKRQLDEQFIFEKR